MANAKLKRQRNTNGCLTEISFQTKHVQVPIQKFSQLGPTAVYS